MKAYTYNGPEPGQATMTLRVKVSTVYRVRIWIALRLMSLAGWLLGYNVEVLSPDE